MFLSSYSDAFSIQDVRDRDEAIRPGDQVRCGDNLYPHFEVIAVNGDEAWLRNITDGSDHLAMLARCRKLASAPGEGSAAE
jgi:hypothetical protein